MNPSINFCRKTRLRQREREATEIALVQKFQKVADVSLFENQTISSKEEEEKALIQRLHFFVCLLSVCLSACLSPSLSVSACLSHCVCLCVACLSFCFTFLSVSLFCMSVRQSPSSCLSACLLHPSSPILAVCVFM